MAPLTRRLPQFPILRLSFGSFSSRFLKYIVFLLFLVNIRSWPLSWHFRIFQPIFALRLRLQLYRLSVLWKPKYVRDRAKARWLCALSPVGENPLNFTVAWRGWATPDDCDFNMHLSNSCYAKSFDWARLAYILKAFPAFFRTGGWMALGGTHYNFLREIRILSRYEVRVSIAAWDHKWIYIVARYVSKPKPKGKSQSRRDSHSQPDLEIRLPPTPPERDARARKVPIPLLHTPAKPDDKCDAYLPPSPVSPTYPLGASPLPADASCDDKPDSRVIAAALRTQARVHEEPDGATLHCVAVSALCFKIGRITVPPALVLACDGFCDSASKTYSHAQPPPFWPHVQRLRGSELDLGALRAFFTGGWREVPERERWWEQAFGGEFEERRQAGMEVVGALRKGMEGVQGL
ncbi:hypothetical protein IEO21_03746 [Rhodonia placenta]|uniref:Thioesterase/thiol ester dehydrase-isomerase n=1 Tax=Rhodonia placenta TaxID=104341 RepID=A0A8H7P546_9APHY|nr:hypothetical protein IEO21_03746 [Postia placenta]